MKQEPVRMTSKELHRLEVIRGALERRLTQKKAAELMGLSVRQVRRLCAAYEGKGLTGLVSRRRGRPSNRRLPQELRARALEIVRDLYPDLGPKLAREKLRELHGMGLSKETLRKWMVAAGVWPTGNRHATRAEQPRHRRARFGELVSINSRRHPWFDDRGPACTLLVYVDDATDRLIELRFVESGSAFDYFAATAAYLGRHGKPAAFYSDEHSVFRAYPHGASDRARGVAQFRRALTELDIGIISGSTPKARDRGQPLDEILQDRLVTELRLRNISSLEEGNAFLPEFMEHNSCCFGRAPADAHNAHRPLQGGEDLTRIFSWQEERAVSRNLTVPFKRVTYLVTPAADSGPLPGKRVRIHEWEGGRVEIHHEGATLPFSIFQKRRPGTGVIRLEPPSGDPPSPAPGNGSPLPARVKRSERQALVNSSGRAAFRA